jgi:hypothetical protein
MTGAQGPNDAHSTRRRLWRFVRDAGRNGVVVGRVLDHFGMLDADLVRQTLSNLKKGGYMTHAGGRGSAWLVDMDCKVPRGEKSELGPGWGDAVDDGLPVQQRIVKAPEAQPEAAVALDLSPAAARPAVALVPPQGVRCWSVLKDYQENTVAAPRPFKASLASDGTLQMQLKDGPTVELDADETRELFAWMDRLAGLCLVDTLPGASA